MATAAKTQIIGEGLARTIKRSNALLWIQFWFFTLCNLSRRVSFRVMTSSTIQHWCDNSKEPSCHCQEKICK
eukprot:14749699-Ditylum_brightwellii.AAC.1